MNETDHSTAADRGSACNAELGPAVPEAAMQCLQAYGDSRADADGNSGLRIGEVILALRRWAAQLQAAERERDAKKMDELAEAKAACYTATSDSQYLEQQNAFEHAARVIRGA